MAARWSSIGLKLDMSTAAAPGQAGTRIDFKTTESEGELLFDPGSGRVVLSRLTIVNDMTVNAGGQSVANQMKQTVFLEAIGPDEEVAFDDEDEKPTGEQ